MVQLANVSKLLYCSTEKESFLLNLTLDDEDRAKLREGRRTVRQHLRDAFAKGSRQYFGVVIAPRFFTQGSFAYKTINEPAWVPPQQMDMDDGCYLPMSFVKGSQPSQAASLFFEFVDVALASLAAEQGWRLVEKPTCSRLVIGVDAHIDVPLYAIPDREFLTLDEAIQKRADSLNREEAKIDRWDQLPSDCVLLAHREEDWKVSDPRKIHNWFVDAVDVYGEKLRRMSRYLKAWRDHHRPHLDSVSSILLMACAFKVFEEIGRRDIPDREDAALLRVLDRLPDLLAGPVSNPADKAENLDARLGDEERKVAISMARDFRDHLRLAVEHCMDRDVAVSEMRAVLGVRVPDRPDLISLTESARAQVRSHAPRIVAAPTVGRSTSG